MDMNNNQYYLVLHSERILILKNDSFVSAATTIDILDLYYCLMFLIIFQSG